VVEMKAREARVKAEVVECSCCGELVSIEEINEYREVVEE